MIDPQPTGQVIASGVAAGALLAYGSHRCMTKKITFLWGGEESASSSLVKTRENRAQLTDNASLSEGEEE